ncbi:uncharacterized protein MKK02DRAFT_42388 [Dioszegia hungarica]|uniref:Uncharacterized protein n=1 Tax=Dioszegia hungarica TaxID=4972 RepID=A0AA38HCD2_9TREE|nr:uncharacterized protein MKK02DRAFT_42388 [Dioszegia hungarica]KAI9638005.1 hypothetical protein MKK02DRAFT_42388 [Dioszegia hungarica]
MSHPNAQEDTLPFSTYSTSILQGLEQYIVNALPSQHTLEIPVDTSLCVSSARQIRLLEDQIFAAIKHLLAEESDAFDQVNITSSKPGDEMLAKVHKLDDFCASVGQLILNTLKKAEGGGGRDWMEETKQDPMSWVKHDSATEDCRGEDSFFQKHRYELPACPGEGYEKTQLVIFDPTTTVGLTEDGDLRYMTHFSISMGEEGETVNPDSFGPNLKYSRKVIGGLEDVASTVRLRRDLAGKVTIPMSSGLSQRGSRSLFAGMPFADMPVSSWPKAFSDLRSQYKTIVGKAAAMFAQEGTMVEEVRLPVINLRHLPACFTNEMLEQGAERYQLVGDEPSTVLD